MGIVILMTERSQKAPLRMLLTFGLALASSSCAIVDESLAPRSYRVNEGWEEYRNNAILLNIIRASNSAPLHFVSLVKYTGTGEATAGMSAQLSYAAADANGARTFGPLTAGSKVDNTIELATLDTTEFTQGMIAEVSPQEFHQLLGSGIPREVLLHVLLDTVQVENGNGDSFDFRNDPLDDKYTGSDPRGCNAYEYKAPFAESIWFGAQEGDCRYHKFNTFVRKAVEYGLDADPVKAINPETGTVKDAPPKKFVWQFCYNAGINREYDRLSTVGQSPSACGKSVERRGDETIPFAYNGRTIYLRRLNPKFRSPIGAFRYLGRLVASGAAQTVRLNRTAEARDLRTGDTRLMTLEGAGAACFAEAAYLGERFCVPAQGAQNTKSVFSLLATLVALRTKRSDLPAATSLVLRP